MILKAYKYCLLPTEDQKSILDGWFGTVRFIYNLALETKIYAWESARKTLSRFDLINQLTELRRDVDWIRSCPRQSAEASISNLDAAYKSFFRGRGFPKFKKRGGRQSFALAESITVRDGRVKLSKIGWLSFVEHRPLGNGEIRGVTVSKTPANNYFVSFLIRSEENNPDKNQVQEETAVGVDMGLKSFAVLSNGQKIQNPRLHQTQLSRLRIEKRKLQKRFKNGVKEQSKGYQKQKLVVAKLHEKIANQRRDFLHKISTAIIKQYDTICLENLNVSGMMKSGKLSRSLSDVGWRSFVELLIYKSEWYGKNIVKIGRFDPSSKTCSDCGNIFKELNISDRQWVCQKCGTLHDRDENAAKNIKNFGLRAKPSTVNVSH